MSKAMKILMNAVPVVAMIALIPIVRNDYMLTAFCAVIIAVSLYTKRERNELFVFIFGFVILIAVEGLFVSAGVEIFLRNSLLGLMPLWLPFLWGYGFVAIKRSVGILGS